MITDKKEIESVLQIGEKILLDHPELYNMSLDDVLVKLDDGTEQMLHNRWGVTAWLVVRSLECFDVKNLVIQLSEIDSGILTYKYAGYLLQVKYQVNLEELILEADKCGKFDKIILYVNENIVFQSKLNEQYIGRIINMIGNHTENNLHRTFLVNYAKHIINMGAQRLTEETLGNLAGQAQYDFMSVLRWEWYQKDVLEAANVAERMIQRGSFWSKKAAIDFVESGFYYDKAIFGRYFVQLEHMVLENAELWQMIIKVFVNYAIKVTSDDSVEEEQLYRKVVEYLKKIPEGTLQEKSCFMTALQWNKEIPKEIVSIFQTLISKSFGKNQHILGMLNNYLYVQLENAGWKIILQDMRQIFIANKYGADYEEFFRGMSTSVHEFSKYPEEVTREALKDMLSADVDIFSFGLGLLLKAGNLSKLYSENEVSEVKLMFSNWQMIRLMKGILYFAVETKKICHMAFQLLGFANEDNSKYIEFCMKEVYGNYPETFFEIAENYKDAKESKQADLANRIIKEHNRILKERELCYKIKDLQPSKIYQNIYRRAQMDQSRQMNKRAHDESFFAQMFPSQILKYGKRSGFIVIGRRNEENFQVSPFAKFEYSVEIPAVYTKDPVEFELRRRKYLEEVKQSASGNKGLPASTERKR